MHPSSFQYQPLNLQKVYNKAPNFLCNRNLEKSIPNITPNKQSSNNANILSKESQSNQNPNKSTRTPSKADTENEALTPKDCMEKKDSPNNLSSLAFKHYQIPKLNKNQEKIFRQDRGQMARSLVIEQSQVCQEPAYKQLNKRKSDHTKYSPRRAPIMSQGYHPGADNIIQQANGESKNQCQPSSKKQEQTNFMKVKESGEKSCQKKPNIPFFLNRNITDMKRSSQQLIYSQDNLKTRNATNTSSLFSVDRRRKVVSTDFQKMKELGNGKYGRVYLARQKSTGFICALKVIEKKIILEEEITEQFIRELKIQMFLDHPNIVKMYGYFDDDDNIYIILEVGTGGQLYHYLKKSQSLQEAKVVFLMKQICDAVNYIHCLRIIHRDIKPQNIVLHDNIIKLCDFGWSVHQDNKLRTTFCGTPLYVCPQILRGKQYDQKIDIWSLGIMMYQMVVGQNPFKINNQEQLIKIIKDQIKIPSYVYVSSEARDFLDKCLQKNPVDRVTIRQLINHPLLKKYQQKEKKTFNL